jgi:hypothetical protein
MFDLVISVPEPGSSRSRNDGYLIRRAALEAGVPYMTTLKEAKTALGRIGGTGARPVSLNEYHAKLGV